ncbi:MAG: DUF4178 domain-containing protein [Lachnospiraceae bacterium]|nr:DUF4178 domain-containing protein [Lachnospiraceae bacterium]
MHFGIGTCLNIDGIKARVIGRITYENIEDRGKQWTEYRLKTPKGEMWLSCDDVYNEYSISKPANGVKGNIGPEWHQVDSGTQRVVGCRGDVDVDFYETAKFVEYEDETEEKTLSVETWSDGTEFSTGYYLDKEEIVVEEIRDDSRAKSGAATGAKIYTAVVVGFIGLSFLGSIFGSIFDNLFVKKIDDYLKSTSIYTYTTSVTGNDGQKAKVYTCESGYTTSDIAEKIINAEDGDVLEATRMDDTVVLPYDGDEVDGTSESVTQQSTTYDYSGGLPVDDQSIREHNYPIALLTKKEYCYVYPSEDDPNVVLVQVSSRKYAYTSDNAPYKCSSSHTSWYRGYYYSKGYSTDSSSFSGTPSAYSSYKGDIVHNIGNGYFDSYSSTIRQESVNRRSSSGGGLSSGK